MKNTNSSTAVKSNGKISESDVMVKSIASKMGEKAKEAIPHVPVLELSIADKIQKISDLNDLIAKRNRLLESKSKLNSFNLKHEESTTKISVQDMDGNSFVTSQSDAIIKILDSLKVTIDRALTDVEDKIQF